MTGPDIKYNSSLDGLRKILRSIRRSGDYFVAGGLEKPPPRMTVSPVGMIAFPILDSQVRALIEAADRAPYGRGPETIVDTSVRDCWQISANSVRFTGTRWKTTLKTILKRVADGLGLPEDRVDVRLYKLLIYEAGGFFSSHRDTEKADRMVATLVISLPVDGVGGELVIRHNGREAVVDLSAEDPGELKFAAFYADCLHLTRPVARGHRVSLVYNVNVKPTARGVPRVSPDSSSQAAEAGRCLAGWSDSGEPPAKLVWLLDHAYSEAGLGLETLKGIDAPVGRALVRATKVAGCALYLAVLEIVEEGIPDYDLLFDRWGSMDHDAPMEEVFDGSYKLFGWVDCHGETVPPFSQIPMLNGEALPPGALDDIEPDEQWVTEATGNEGASAERSYRWAAFVTWPHSRTIRVVAQGGIENALDYARLQLDQAHATRDRRSLGVDLAGQLLDVWPRASSGFDSEGFMELYGKYDLRMLDMLLELQDRRLTLRFLENVAAKQYHEDLNNSLVLLLGWAGPAGLQAFFKTFVKNHAVKHFGGVVKLLVQLGDLQVGTDGGPWESLLRAGAREAIGTVPQVLALPPKEPFARWRTEPKALSAGAVRDLFLASEMFGLAEEMARAGALIERRPEQVSPYRTLPKALSELKPRSTPLMGLPALVSLWRYAANRLLARSAFPPPGPEDRSIVASIECECQHCRRIKTFCRDRGARVLRYPVRQQIRRHMRGEIRYAKVAVTCETERRGRPYTLICRKTEAGYAKRVSRYEADIASMRLLESAAPVTESLSQLRMAISRSR